MEAGRDALLQRRLRQEVTGQLLHREPVERHVAVDGVDDPVAEQVGVRPQGVVEVPGAVGETGLVEPVAAPALPKMRRGEESVDEALDGARGAVCEEGLHVRWRGW